MSERASAERYCPSCERSYHEGRLCPDDGTELVVLANAPDPLIGRSLNDRYTIQQRLGAGGMGTVYRGIQHSVGRDVAIKVVSPGLVTDPAAIKRFLREAKLASRLSHPHAVSMLDFGQTPDGLFFLVMELLAGRTLDKVIRAEGRLALPRVARIADQICDALEGAHRLEIIHRDLKPANTMLLDGDRDLVKVLDFGLAKSLSKDSTTASMTGSGALLGTPAYMSPEAALGRELDARCDLYSLGCMLYVLASGRLPFHSDSVHELVSMQANVPPPPITGVPSEVAVVIMRLLAKNPADRYASAAETRRALADAVAESRRSPPMAIETTLPVERPVSALAATIASSPALAATIESSPALAATIASAPARAATPEPASVAPAVASPARRTRWIAIAVFAVASAAGLAVWLVGASNDGPAPAPPAATTPATPTPPTVTAPPTVTPVPAETRVEPPPSAPIAAPPAAPDGSATKPPRRDPKSRRPIATPTIDAGVVEPSKPVDANTQAPAAPPVDAKLPDPPRDASKEVPW